MDFFAHALWTAIIFRHETPVLIPIIFGAIPDIISWGVLFVQMIATGKFWDTFKRARKMKHPDFSSLPKWIWTLYGITHSIFTFAFVLGISVLITGKIFIPVFAWLLHLLIDIPTHSRHFLGTPFLWPLSNWKFPGYSWGNLWFVVVNYVLITAAIIYFFGILGEFPILF